jgi:hypothetical protein
MSLELYHSSLAQGFDTLIDFFDGLYELLKSTWREGYSNFGGEHLDTVEVKVAYVDPSDAIECRG